MNRKDGTRRLTSLEVPMEWKGLNDAGTFSGYASIFGNVDLGGDIIERGAFNEIAKTKAGKVRVLYQHDMRQPIGDAYVKQDDKGLAFDGQLALGIAQARNAHEGMKAGILDGMSIGFDILQGGSEIMNSGLRKLTNLKLWEISVVTFGMNPAALIDSVKSRASDCKTIRQFEELLRDACGFSNAQAKALACGGWNALQKARDESGEDAKALTNTIDFLKNISGDTTVGSLTSFLQGVK